MPRHVGAALFSTAVMPALHCSCIQPARYPLSRALQARTAVRPALRARSKHCRRRSGEGPTATCTLSDTLVLSAADLQARGEMARPVRRTKITAHCRLSFLQGKLHLDYLAQSSSGGPVHCHP